MTALKAHEVDQFLNNPAMQEGLFLAYGTDAGLVHERAKRLSTYFAGDTPDPMAQIILDMSDIDKDRGLLATEARTSSLFGGTKIVRVRNATKSLAPIIEELLADWPPAIVIVQAANLTPRDKLRILFERSKLARTLPCYADNAQSLNRLIQQTFTVAKISVEPEAISALSGLLGNDREITRRELEKLVLFAERDKTLSFEDVITLCGDNTSIAMDQILDAAATGHIARLENALMRAINGGIDPQRILAASLNHFVWLRNLRVEVDGGQSVTNALNSTFPRPHFSRKASLEQQVRLWSDGALARASDRLLSAIRTSRQTAQLAETEATRALLALCIMASKH